MSKIPNFEMFNFEKQRPVSDAEWPQNSNGAICSWMVIFSVVKKDHFALFTSKWGIYSISVAFYGLFALTPEITYLLVLLHYFRILL